MHNISLLSTDEKLLQTTAAGGVLKLTRRAAFLSSFLWALVLLVTLAQIFGRNPRLTQNL